MSGGGGSSTAFQFHLVRLKGWNAMYAGFETVFQFHLVRLKAGFQSPFLFTNLSFQFHLVRLKEKVKVIYYDELRFQFHLVRLKGEEKGRIHIHGIFVSIPFSTIKRKQGRDRH